MRGNVYRSGGRRTGSSLLGVGVGSIVLAVGVGLALALAMLMSSASTAFARGYAAAQFRPPVVEIAESHTQAIRLPPAIIAHAAGHKIA
jgi:hypothetical protein